MSFSFREYFSRREPARLDGKASRTGALVALFSGGRPRWTPRDYQALAREGYAKNPIAFRSVRMIAEAAANVPLLLYEGAREHDEHPLLALLSHPNSRQTGADLIEQLAGYLLVSGNAYLERVSVLDEARELHALRPDRMKVIPGAEGWAEAYEYRAGSSAVRFAMSETPAPILHLTLFNPLDDHYGMSPLEAAQASLDVHNAASAWNKALLDNAARPSGALVYSAAGGNLSDEQFERLKSELEAHYQGAANAGRPLLLEGGLDWKGLSLSPKDMDFVEAKHIAAREIALSFGVPPMLLGIPGDNTYSNYAEANRAFYRQTVVPLVTRIASALGHWLGESFGGGLRLAPDLDEVPALSIEREALWKRVGEASFLTDDEKREAAGYEPLPASFAPSSLATLRAKYDPSQPRVPAGNPDGGQWTDGGGGYGDSEADEGDQELLPASAIPIGWKPDGHHFMVQSIFRKWNLKPETLKVFEEAKTGKLYAPGHLFDAPHRQYNEAIRALSDDFLVRNSLTGRTHEMTPDQARALLKEIRESRDVRIWNYNRMILMRELRYRWPRIFRGE
jgi:HK97 family phage portal protein